MAISSKARFSNAAQGFPQVGADFDPYESNSNPKWALGTMMPDQRGNVYRYVHFGAAVNAGEIVAQDFSESSQDDSLTSLVDPGSAVAIPGDNLSAGKIGSKFVEMTLSDVTADQFAGGDLLITTGTGKGFTYRIRGNTATGNPATATMRMELYKPLQSAIDATSGAMLIGSRYANCEISSSATDNDIAGVAMNYHDADNFGWVLTKGRTLVKRDATTIAQGDILSLSQSVSGAVEVLGQNSESNVAFVAGSQIVGYCVSIGQVSGELCAQINID